LKKTIKQKLFFKDRNAAMMPGIVMMAGYLLMVVCVGASQVLLENRNAIFMAVLSCQRVTLSRLA
jgi:hypothetical protein